MALLRKNWWHTSRPGWRRPLWTKTCPWLRKNSNGLEGTSCSRQASQDSAAIRAIHYQQQWPVCHICQWRGLLELKCLQEGQQEVLPYGTSPCCQYDRSYSDANLQHHQRPKSKKRGFGNRCQLGSLSWIRPSYLDHLRLSWSLRPFWGRCRRYLSVRIKVELLFLRATPH